MIDQSHLTHWLVFDRIVSAGPRDPVTGKKGQSRSEVRIPCFYDATARSVRPSETGKRLMVSGTVFILPTDTIHEQDEITRVEDTFGRPLLERTLKVVGIRLFNDDDGAHHQEVYVMEDHAS